MLQVNAGCIYKIFMALKIVTALSSEGYGKGKMYRQFLAFGFFRMQ